MTTIDLPLLSNKRECGTCTKCCEGWLTGNVRGHKMFPGKPCFFVEQGVGCKDYENRPKDPCINFSCAWKEILEMPEEFKPEISGVIVQLLNIDNTKFIVINNSPNEPSLEMLSWIMVYVKSKHQNLLWSINNKNYWIGDEDFCKLMEREHSYVKR